MPSSPHRPPGPTAAAAPLVIDVEQRDDTTLLRPVGQLDASTSDQLRDALLEHAAEHPDLLVVDLDGLRVHSVSALAVFTAVAAGLDTWPGIALKLVAHGLRAAELRAYGLTRFVPTLAEALAEALADAGGPSARPRVLLPLHGATSARGARDWVRDRLHDCAARFPDFVDAAVQIASELVENAVRHTGAPDTLRLERHPRGLSIAVTDHRSGAPVAVAPDDATTSGGRGLAMVAALAQAWGHRLRAGGGKVVWAVLPLPRGAGPVLG